MRAPVRGSRRGRFAFGAMAIAVALWLAARAWALWSVSDAVAGFEKRPRTLRHEARLVQKLDDGLNRLADVVILARGHGRVGWRILLSACRRARRSRVRFFLFFFRRSKVGRDDGIGGERCVGRVWRVPRLPRHLKEGARVG